MRILHLAWLLLCVPGLGSSHDDNDLIEQLAIYSAEDENSKIVNWPDELTKPEADYRIEREQIRLSGARTLLDILKILPGFDVSRTLNGDYQISTRGIRNDARTPLIIDGLPAQNGYTGQNFWELPADLIESVCVYPDHQIEVTTRRHEGLQVHVWGGANTHASIALGHKNHFLEAFVAAQLNIEDRISASSVGSLDLLLSRSLDMHLLAHAQVSPQLVKGDVQLKIPYGKQNQFQIQFFAKQYGQLTLGGDCENSLYLGRNHMLIWTGRLDVTGLVDRIIIDSILADRWQLSQTFQMLFGVHLLSFSDIHFDLSKFFSPILSLSIKPHQQWRFDINFTSKPRPPTLAEKYDQNDPLFQGNPQLQSERNSSAEVHVTFQTSKSHPQLTLEGLAYLSYLSDAIEKLDENGNSNLIRNAGSYYIGGLEGQTRLAFSDGSYFFANIGWFRGYWHSKNWSLITNLPQLRLNLGVNMALGSIATLNMTTEFGSERRNNIRTDLERQRPYQIEPYSLLNVTLLTKPILKYFMIEGRIYNLFNFKTRDDLLRPDTNPGLVPREGLAWYVGLLAFL